MSIEIDINGRKLHIPKGLKLNREVESTVLTKSDTAYDFNYPIEIPLTEAARFALGFPDELSTINRDYKLSGNLIIDGIFFSSVNIVVLSINKRSKTCRISILGTNNNLYALFGNKKVCDLEMGGIRIVSRTETGFDPINYVFPHIEIGLYDKGELRLEYRASEVNAYMTAIAKGIITEDFLFPKAADLKGDIPGVADSVAIINAYDDARDRYVDADLWNAMAMTWEYMPSVTPSPNPFANNERHFWVPMFKLVRVLEEIFAEAGITLEADILTDPKFAKLLLYNTYAINTGVAGYYDYDAGRPAADNWYQLTAGTLTAIINPYNHLPQMGIAEFLLQLAKRFNLCYGYDALAQKVVIKEDRNFVANADIILDITNIADPKPSINYEVSDSFINGYKFSFASDPLNDATSEDVADDVQKKNYLGAVNSFAGLGGLGTPAIGDIAYVKNENAYYIFQNAVNWILYSHNINVFSTTDKDNLQEVETKVISLPMKMQEMQMLGLYPAYAYAGPIIGDYYTNDNEIVPFSKIGMNFGSYNYFDWDDTREWADYPYDPGGGLGHPWEAHKHQAPAKKTIEHLPTLLSYVGKVEGIFAGDEYYGASSGPFDNAGTLYPDIYPCCWSNASGVQEGIYKEWWLQLVKDVHNSVSTERPVLMDAATYHKLDINRTLFVIEGLRYVLKKANFVMPFPEIATLYLVRV